MYCPKCHAEYRKGYTTCKECGVDLVASLPKEGEPEDEELVALARFSNTAEASMVKELLEDNGITCVFHGGSDPIGVPSGAEPIELLVDQKDLEKADKLFQAFFESAEDDGEPEGEPSREA